MNIGKTFKRKTKKEVEPEKQKDFVEQLRIAYNALDDPKKFYRTILVPSLFIGILMFLIPFILDMIIGFHLELNPITFIIGGIIPIFLGITYPYISWKNRENDINGELHFFITHLRVLAISDLSLKDIFKIIGEKKAYRSLGDEIKKISVLSNKWRYPMAKTLHFIAERSPSKTFSDFLDRFSQSIDSGVEHREFIEIEQEAVIEEYKTMYETSNENIVILNEIYVSLLIAVVFIMSFGIVLPMIMGAETITTYVYLSSFLLILSEILLLYLLRAMIPRDDFWHQSKEKGRVEIKLIKEFKMLVLISAVIGIILIYLKYILALQQMELLSIELLFAIAITPLVISGIKVIIEEDQIMRKEKNFLAFLPALGSIATMKGGKINDSVYYLSRKDYGVLTKYIRHLYRRLRTRIDDDSSWSWFGIDTGSNYIQRSSEMFREATYSAASPRKVSKMISNNIRKIHDLRKKKLTIVNTTIALFAGITFGISFSIYVSLVISEHMNNIIMETGDPFSGLDTINIGTLLYIVPPEVFETIMMVIFMVLTIHCFVLSYTLKTLRGSHTLLSFLFFTPFVWIIAITANVVRIIIGGMLV